MTELAEDLDAALAEVIEAARAHLAAVRAAGGALDDETVWRTFVTLNNASYAYDQLLLDRHGEVTPWETEPIDLRPAAETPYLIRAGRLGDGTADPYPAVLSVRQRRDYRVPSQAALLAAAEEAAQRGAAPGEQVEPPATVADAVLELVRDGDGSLAGLDLPELEPLAGVVTVVEAAAPLDADNDQEDRLFQVGQADRVVGRLHEEPFVEPDDDLELDSEPGEGSR